MDAGPSHSRRHEIVLDTNTISPKRLLSELFFSSSSQGFFFPLL